MMELFQFMRDVATNKQTWCSEESKMTKIITARSEIIVTTFNPEIDLGTKAERVGKIRSFVQTVLSRALGY